MFENVIGQDINKQIFSKLLEKGTVPQSLLFYGPEGIGKTAFSIDLAKILTCHNQSAGPCGNCVSCVKFEKFEHPDVSLYFPFSKSVTDNEKLEIEMQEIRTDLAKNPYCSIATERNSNLHIEMVRNIKQKLKLHSFQGNGRIVIILGCQKLNQETGNALLKVLEEPPVDTHIILTTTDIENMLPTIKSRCQVIQFSRLTESEINNGLQKYNDLDPEDAKLASFLSNGSMSLAHEMIKKEIKTVTDFLEQLLMVTSEKTLLENMKFVDKWIEQRQNVVEINFILLFLIGLLKYYYEKNTLIKNSQNYIFFSPQIVEKMNGNVIESMINELENSIDLISKNVYLYSILLNLIFKLKTIFNNGK